MILVLMKMSFRVKPWNLAHLHTSLANTWHFPYIFFLLLEHFCWLGKTVSCIAYMLTEKLYVLHHSCRIPQHHTMNQLIQCFLFDSSLFLIVTIPIDCHDDD